MNKVCHKDSAIMWALVYCKYPGCTVALKCSVMVDPELNPENNIEVICYGYGIRNHRAVKSIDVASTSRVKQPKRKVTIFCDSRNFLQLIIVLFDLQESLENHCTTLAMHLLCTCRTVRKCTKITKIYQK